MIAVPLPSILVVSPGSSNAQLRVLIALVTRFYTAVRVMLGSASMAKTIVALSARVTLETSVISGAPMLGLPGRAIATAVALPVLDAL